MVGSAYPAYISKIKYDFSMSNTSPELPQIGNIQPEVESQTSTFENAKPHNKPEQQSKVLQTLSESQKLQIKSTLQPFVGIKKYTSQFSPKSANPEFIKRSRQLYSKLCSELIKDYSGWHVAIEPDSNDYFLNTNKAVAQQLACQKYPERMICTFQLIGAG